MDYEKKYNEALEIARQIHNGNPSSGTAIVVCEQIFPELRESEDEWIRRRMVEHFKSKTKETWCNIPVKDILKWLEKQQEQQPVEWSDEDENKIESIKGLVLTGRFADTNTIRTIWNSLNSLRPRASWKPSEEQMSSLKQARDYYMSGRIKYVGRHLSEIVEQLEKL